MNLDKAQIKKILYISSAVMFAVAVITVAVLVIVGLKGGFDPKPAEETKKPNTATAVPSDGATKAPESSATSVPTYEPTAVPTEAPMTYKDVTLLAAGDYLIYNSMRDSAKAYGGGTYDFTEMTKYVNDYIGKHDFSAVNLEGVVSEGNYSAYPTFRYPDAVIDAIKKAGFTSVLFANNHTYDNGRTGLMRTQEKLKEAGLNYLGTRLDTESKGFGIIDVGGVKIGMLNYTYEAPAAGEELSTYEKFLNGIRMEKYCPECKECIENAYITDEGTHSTCGARIVFTRDLVYSYNPNLLDRFYEEIEANINELEKNGAEMVVAFMHWGSEYQHQANSQQKEIAQKLCDMGVDLLIGGHPHVVQPVDTYESADKANRMLCYYSLGNFVSAQNRRNFNDTEKGTYTENELFASVTVRRYSSGEVIITKADYKPLWLHSYSNGSRMIFNVIPLDEAFASDDAPEKFDLTKSSYGVAHGRAAFDYIKGLVQSGIDEFNNSVTLLYPDAIKEE